MTPKQHGEQSLVIALRLKNDGKHEDAAEFVMGLSQQEAQFAFIAALNLAHELMSMRAAPGDVSAVIERMAERV